MPARRQSRDLIPLDPDRCPDCARRLHVEVQEQPALFRHAGFGATLRTLVRWCWCGWTLVADVTEVNPRRR